MIVGGVWNSCGRTRGVLIKCCRGWLSDVGQGCHQMLDRGVIRCSRRHFQMVIGNRRECFQRGCSQLGEGIFCFRIL